MSMISELVNKLRFYEAWCKGAEFKKVLGEAANTIEELSTKLQADNMERSEKYYERSVPDTNVGHKTNADRIRNMSDEELANVITCPFDFRDCEDCWKVDSETACNKRFLEWLQKEVE